MTTDYHSPTHSWSDSPEGTVPYHNGSCLTLAGVIDLTDAQCPQMTFWHLRDLGGGWYGYADVSTNYGHDWSTVGSWSGHLPWSQVQVDLAPYAGSLLRVRFRIYGSGGYDGWSIDDVRIEDAPTVVIETPTNVTRHGADLSWIQMHEPDFDRYEVYRKVGPGVTYNDELVYTTAIQSDTTWLLVTI